MKRKIMTGALALLIAAGSTQTAMAAVPQNSDSLKQLMESIKEYITEHIKQESSQGSITLPEASNSKASQVISLTNSERKKAGLEELEASSSLSRLAQLKAEDMAAKGYFSHTSPTYGSAFDMLKNASISYRSAGENLAKGQHTAQSAMNGWMNSSGHRANILGSQYSEIGVGVAENSKGTIYWVQIFKG